MAGKRPSRDPPDHPGLERLATVAFFVFMAGMLAYSVYRLIALASR